MDEQIRQMLLEIYTDDEAEHWYCLNHELLGHRSAEELVESGHRDVVISAIQCLLDSAYI